MPAELILAGYNVALAAGLTTGDRQGEPEPGLAAGRIGRRTAEPSPATGTWADMAVG